MRTAEREPSTSRRDEGGERQPAARMPELRELPDGHEVACWDGIREQAEDA